MRPHSGLFPDIVILKPIDGPLPTNSFIGNFGDARILFSKYAKAANFLRKNVESNLPLDFEVQNIIVEGYSDLVLDLV